MDSKCKGLLLCLFASVVTFQAAVILKRLRNTCLFRGRGQNELESLATQPAGFLWKKDTKICLHSIS